MLVSQGIRIASGVNTILLLHHDYAFDHASSLSGNVENILAFNVFNARFLHVKRNGLLINNLHFKIASIIKKELFYNEFVKSTLHHFWKYFSVFGKRFESLSK